MKDKRALRERLCRGADWGLLLPLLDRNEALLGIEVARLVGGLSPERAYRKIVPAGHKALAPEEGWVRPEG